MNRYRTLIVLWLAQCFGQTSAPTLVLVSGLVGARLAPSMEWATLPVAMMVIGTACATIPASLLMSRFGRKAGFLGATAYAIGGGLLAAWAVTRSDFTTFCVSAFMVGNYLAFLQQFRFAVAESVPADTVAKAISFLMLAGIVAAVLGPEMAARLSELNGLPMFAGSFLGLSVMLLMSFLILLFFYRNVIPTGPMAAGGGRPLGEIVRQPKLILAVAAAAAGWSIMSLIMTATPVSMHEMDHHSLEDTKWVIQSHILAMFVPSLFSGFLVARFGAVKIIGAGMLLMLGCMAAGYDKPQLMHYWWSMVLLGIGWNFLFLGGTTLLTECYRMEERFKVQALNDFLVFGLQAFGSLGAGWLLANLGWNGVILLGIPWLLILVPILWMFMQSQQSPVAKAS